MLNDYVGKEGIAKQSLQYYPQDSSRHHAVRESMIASKQ